MAALQFLLRARDAEDAASGLSSPKASGNTGTDPRSVFPQKRQFLDEGLEALNLARNNTSKQQYFRSFDRFAFLRCEIQVSENK
jgi:hypothetical protein